MKYYENGWFFTCYGESNGNDLNYRKFRVDLDTTTETEHGYVYWRIPINAVCHNNFGCNSKICIGRRALNILDMDKITVHQITLDCIEFSNKGSSVNNTTHTTYVYNNDKYAVDVDTVSKYMHIYKIM